MDSHSTDCAFIYGELNEDIREFRLLVLFPATEFSSPIRISIFSGTLSTPPEYEALSYVWGDPKITAPVQDEIGQDRFRVTTNLELALRYLRLQSRPRKLWIDALCINQRNIPERNSQVRQMRDIYLSAQQVVVWIGEEGNAKVALAMCKKIQTEQSHAGNTLGPSLAVLNDGRAIEACRELFARPWWTRTWILQEVLHHKPVQVYIGDLLVTLDDLGQYFEIYQTVQMRAFARASWQVKRDTAMDPFFGSYVDMIKISTSVGAVPGGISQLRSEALNCLPNTIFDLSLIVSLQMFRGLQCSDPRDKVYALLAMSDPPYDIEVNYDASKSSLYTNVMKLLLHVATDTLFLVECSERDIGRKDDLPSWVPDWTLQQSEFPRFMHDHSGNFNAGLAKEDAGGRPWTTFDGDDLLLRGIYIAVIVGVKDGFNCYNVFAPGSENTAKIFTYDCNSTLRSESAIQSQTLDSSRTLRNSSWGPIRAEVGDIVVVPEGSAAPLVLRRYEDAYLLVGVCWLIDSELQRSDVDTSNFHEDPGWSTVMHGSAWDPTILETFRVV